MSRAAASPDDPGRLVALDVFRGLTVALMILVNNPGSWAHVYPPLRHAAWHGLTPTDLVFPFFLFIVGAAMALSLDRRAAAGATRADLLRKIAARTALIFLCGLLLGGFPFGLPLSAEAAADFGPGRVAESLRTLRVMGVLQRIALAYGAAALVVTVWPRARARLAAGLALVAAYELLMRLPLVAGWGAGSFAPVDNFARLVDLTVLGEARIWRSGGLACEPEGLVSTLPAIVTVLLGHAAGRLLRVGRPLADRLRALLAAGAAGTAAGVLLALLEPVNKQLWTVSYAVLTAGLAALVLAVCLALIDGRGWRRGVRPAVIFGLNPLVAFLGSGLLARVLGLVRVPGGEGATVSLRHWLYTSLAEPAAGPAGGSLLYALANVAFWLAVLWAMDRRGLRVKI
ncbi:MAG: acyltransferase family protein [Candidatus Krumholzibacteriia bacterium]